MRLGRIFWVIILLSVLPLTANAQWNFNISTENEYNDNPFRSQLPTETFINSLNFDLRKEFDLFSLQYSGNYFNFSAVPERNFYMHQLSASVSFENGAMGIIAEQRLGKDIYTYFDYTNITGYYTHQFNIEDYYLTLTPNLSLTKYPGISILDNSKISLSTLLNHGFDSGTTVILGGAFTFKKYLNPTQYGEYTYLDENNSLVTERYIDQNISSLTQILSFARIAQSVTPTTGIAAQFTNRSILSGVASFVKDLNMIYGDESEIFDDPVNYEGNNYSVEVTQILFDDLTLKGSLFLNNKFYPSQGVYDQANNYDTGIMRSDKQKIFNFTLNKSFPLGDSESINLNLGLQYQWIDNSSNSTLFNYRSNSVNLSLGIEF